MKQQMIDTFGYGIDQPFQWIGLDFKQEEWMKNGIKHNKFFFPSGW